MVSEPMIKKEFGFEKNIYIGPEADLLKIEAKIVLNFLNNLSCDFL